jgi:hypothetical protein
MRIFLWFAIACVIPGYPRAQDGMGAVWNAIDRREKELKALPGVKEITVGSVSGEIRIVIRVESEPARDAVRKLCGEKLEGYPYYIIISSPTTGTVPESTNPSPATRRTDAPLCTHACPAHCKEAAPGHTLAGPGGAAPPPPPKFDIDRIDDPKYAQEKCDILRHYFGLPKAKHEPPYCEQIISWSNDPAKVRWVIANGFPHWTSVDVVSLRGGGVIDCPEHGRHAVNEVICYTWIKHRQYCPLGMKQILSDIDSLTPKPGKK